MFPKTFLTILLFCSMISFIVGAPTCPSGWKYYTKTNACYFASKDSVTFTDAVDNCKQMDSNLVSIHSADENQFVSKFAEENNNPIIWIGLRVVNGNSYQNVDGTPVDFQNWVFPNDYGDLCVQSNVHPALGTWYQHWWTDPCNSLTRYVCKKSFS